MKMIKQYKAEKPLPYLEGDWLYQTDRISSMLRGAYGLGVNSLEKKAKKQINEAYIHLSRLVHSM